MMIAGIESRGFIVASCIAIRFGLGVTMIRKAGKFQAKLVGSRIRLNTAQPRWKFKKAVFYLDKMSLLQMI